MFAYHRPGGYGDDGKGFAGCILNSPGFASVQDAGRDLIFGNPGWSVIVACKQPQNGKRHIRAAARGAGRNHFGTRPAASDGIERQRQIGIVFVGVMTLHLKCFGGIDQRATCIAHRVGIPHIHVAVQSRAQQRIETAVHGDNVIALPC